MYIGYTFGPGIDVQRAGVPPGATLRCIGTRFSLYHVGSLYYSRLYTTLFGKTVIVISREGRSETLNGFDGTWEVVGLPENYITGERENKKSTSFSAFMRKIEGLTKGKK